jgi:hypothetical protein
MANYYPESKGEIVDNAFKALLKGGFDDFKTYQFFKGYIRLLIVKKN